MLSEPHHDGSELYVLERPEEPGADAVLRLRAPRDQAARVWLRYVLDGEPRTVEAVVDEESAGERWWRAELPMQNAVQRYRWLVDVGTRWVNGTGIHDHDVPGADDFVLALGRPAPRWHARSVVYEIFPDRFASSGAAHELPSWAVPRPWDALPEGRGPTTPFEFFGGDLAGIEAHLDHISGLGANAIYLTPIFPAGSTHRYDASSFEHVDPLLGGDDAFRSLLGAAHARDIRVLGDLTMNHCGAGHEWFRRALADPSSPERELFFFDGSPPHGYACWLGVDSLPTLNWGSPDLRRRMAHVFEHWLEAGLDGWRVDVANMVGRNGLLDVNHDVASLARRLVGDKLLVAEHGHDFRPDLDGRGWHGVMNYAGFLRPAWWWLHGGTQTEEVFSRTPAPNYSGTEAVAVMQSFRAGVPWDAVANSWTLLDSHDTARFRTVTASRAKHIAGIGLQMTMPGVPMVFAGDEVGVEGSWGEDARRTMPWEDPESWDAELLAAYRALIALRRSSPALAHGGLRWVRVADDGIAYLRESRDEQLLCLAARVPQEPAALPFPELEPLYESELFRVWRLPG
ncbi:MAG: glycoside hydrolase family 13 protein [Actinobacteria bacterium]|nr:glycoside hydrolase family 13 protein [Actinomycetota bacterium]